MALDSLRSAVEAGAGGHRTLAEKAFTALHEAIVTGTLQPGERLPIEDLAETFDMSPMPIREALRRLDSVGLVENVPHRGARVTELSAEDLQDVYEGRLALEPLAVRHAAERFDDHDRETAQDALTRHIAAVERDDLKEIWRTHTDFHFALYCAGGSRWLVRLITPLWESSERYRFASRPIQRTVAARQEEHERILAACAANDPTLAVHELRCHLSRTANAISVTMGGEELFPLDEGGPDGGKAARRRPAKDGAGGKRRAPAKSRRAPKTRT
jgi:DNA-binding GntR family transcriptional regulator